METNNSDWIKTFGELPEIGEEYVLVTLFHSVYFGSKTKKEWFIDMTDDCEYADKDDVIAWQPLPKPYKEQSNSDWIKVSESKPKFGDWVFVTLECGKLCFGCEGYLNDWTIAYDFPCWSHITNINEDKISAWKPLPKPYKKESDEK